jgi:hypothetical protein
LPATSASVAPRPDLIIAAAVAALVAKAAVTPPSWPPAAAAAARPAADRPAADRQGAAAVTAITAHSTATCALAALSLSPIDACGDALPQPSSARVEPVASVRLQCNTQQQTTTHNTQQRTATHGAKDEQPAAIQLLKEALWPGSDDTFTIKARHMVGWV